MKQIFCTLVLIITVLGIPYITYAQGTVVPSTPTVQTPQKEQFKARRKEINRLIKKYKKAAPAEKPAIKAQLTTLVSKHVDDQLTYMKNRIADERTNLDNWEAKIKADEANLDQVKAQRVEDLLSGTAKQKQKEAKKAWKKQIKQLKK